MRRARLPLACACRRERGSCPTMRAGVPVNDTTPASASRPWWRRLLRPALAVAALAVVFGWLLPQFIDYQQVWDAVTELDGWEVVVLLGLGLARVPTEALMYRAFLAGPARCGAGARPTCPRTWRRRCSRRPPRASSSTATSLAAATRRTPLGLPRWARSCSRRSAGSCFRSSRSCCCSSPARSTAPSCWRARSRWRSRSSRASPATTSFAQSAPRAGSARSCSDRSRGSSSSSSATRSTDGAGRAANSAPTRSPSCARAGRWGRSGSRPTCS